jgi:GNAT superfamily N-acetyltransferase
LLHTDERSEVKPEGSEANAIRVRAMATVPTIRLLTAVDLDAAFGLSAGAGWNQRLDDWRMLLQLAPAGAFAATKDDGTIVGTAIGIDYGTFGWIAMMLVDPAWRGRGLGARLLEAAMGAVSPGIAIRLDATPLGRRLYRRYGFEDEDALTRHMVGPLDAARGGPLDAARGRPSRTAADRTVESLSKRVRRLTADQLPAVIETDDRIFGAHRRILLEWALDTAGQYAHTIDSDAGVQYCLGRPGRLFDQIGPVVASDDETAQALVGASLLAADGKAVIVDAFDRHDRFTDWLRSRGFVASRPLFRMRRHPRDSRSARSSGDASREGLAERAILGPEFG